MKVKLKKINPSLVINTLKSSLVGVVISILLVLLFAFVLKFVDLSTTTISLVDQIIKIISIFIAVLMLSNVEGEKFLFKGLLVGGVYAIITFLVFSILNGGFNFGLGIVADIAFSSLVGGASAILLNIIKKK